ncbi:MAG: hypothetical protein V4527_13730 [Pseudomonadota bacterium]
MPSNRAEFYSMRAFAALVCIVLGGIVYLKFGGLWENARNAQQVNQATSTGQSNQDAVSLAEKMIKEAGASPEEAQSATLDQLAAQAAAGTRRAASEGTAPTGDPYFAGQKALHQQEYERSKAQLIERVARAEFASRCDVIPKFEVDTISISGMNSISRADLNAGMSDYHPDLIKSLRSVALQVAKAVDQNPNRCDYWRQNAEAVAQMRQEADLSRY